MPAKNLGEKQSVREPRPTRRGSLFCGPAREQWSLPRRSPANSFGGVRPDLVDGRARIMTCAPVFGLSTGLELPSFDVLTGDEEGFPDVAHGDRCHR